jgi:hypothetical protein
MLTGIVAVATKKTATSSTTAIQQVVVAAPVLLFLYFEAEEMQERERLLRPFQRPNVRLLHPL